MIIPTTTNLTLTTVPTATFVAQTTGTTSASSSASLGINEILTITFGIVASLTAGMAVMISCMQLNRGVSPRSAGDRRVCNAGDEDEIKLRPDQGNARAASAPPAPSRNSEGSTTLGSNRMKNGATM